MWIRIDKSDGSEEPETEERVQRVAKDFYWDGADALEAAKQGQSIHSPFAIYRWIEEV